MLLEKGAEPVVDFAYEIPFWFVSAILAREVGMAFLFIEPVIRKALDIPPQTWRRIQSRTTPTSQRNDRPARWDPGILDLCRYSHVELIPNTRAASLVFTRAKQLLSAILTSHAI
jgi:hypothetical protein